MNNHSTPQNKPFFVGYLPMPPALKKFYWPLAVSLIIACAVAGYFLAAQQHAGGPAVWNNAAPIKLHGVLTLHPYPALNRPHPRDNSRIESILLVAQGKHSAQKFADEFAAKFNGQAVVVEGYEIKRGGWTMLEVIADNPIRIATESHDDLASRLAVDDLGAVSIRGEIVDSKCYLGVMRPGAGAVHKACAEVCLLGGIPPLLIAKDENARQFGYLIAADGIADEILAHRLAHIAAERVQIDGRLQRRGDLLFIAVADIGDIERL